MKKIFLLATSVAMTLAMTTRAEAAIQFDPTGGGCVTTCFAITAFDPAPGNSISVGLNGQTTPVGTVTDLYFQANLGVALNGSTTVFSQGDLGEFFTFAASFDEKLIGRTTTATGNTLLEFGAPTPTGEQGTFKIYAQTTGGNNLTGICFVDDCGGTLILEGTLVNNAFFSGNFTTNFGTGFKNLDCGTPDALGNCDPTADNYPTVDSITGGGSFNATIRVTFADNAYFPDLVDGSSFVFATTQQTLPYTSADPSACFSSDATTSCNYDGVLNTARPGPGVGSTNGLGADTMLQTDASLTFVNATEIPEPATMTMLGLGLLGVAAARKFRSRKA